ncbi:MAG TPA: DNA-deoxyinosine glycosylase [Steroidobacteraceae bacterium]|nr:DNA-deoxyinosine glycosylase [Steroidobacteraceae bacterium]
MPAQRRQRADEIPASVGFAPISAASARILILGSLPGQMSLQRGEYYAQPHNAFWRIMGALFDAGPNLPYAERKRRLIAQDVAVWDVCASARRAGSLDASIASTSVVPNDFVGFYAAHPRIESIGLNGAAAAVLYERLVERTLAQPLTRMRRVRLPSTSPAHASMSFDQKLAAWSEFRQLAMAGRTVAA